MTFDDDLLQFEFDGGTKRTTCKAIGIDWPPPEIINFAGFDMQRHSMSNISDKQRAGMTHVCRAAVYEVKQ
jgi:hypothetical protein